MKCGWYITFHWIVVLLESGIEGTWKECEKQRLLLSYQGILVNAKNVFLFVTIAEYYAQNDISELGGQKRH